MSVIAPPEQDAIALFSSYGQTWQDETSVSAWTPSPRVTRIVIGKLEGGSEGTKPRVDLPDDLAGFYPNLTHLHLWNVSNLEKLPAKLPEKLKCLDLRKCEALASLPVLPASLEIVDLGDCGSLTSLPVSILAALRWFHVDRATALDPVDINIILRSAVSLEEFTASGCTQLFELSLPRQTTRMPELVFTPFPEKRLKKLVLTDCNELVRLPDLRPYPVLHYLDLNGCRKLREMPALPVSFHGSESAGIRTLHAANCGELRTFLGLDVRPVHLGQSPDDNVADTFRTLSLLAADPADFVMGKVLFLGSGRCGKTTVSKALQWSLLPERERSSRAEDLDPRRHQPSTDKIRFASVREMSFDLPGREPRNGALHLWDFGGQEVYHTTHRLFASQGAVFVIATTSPETHHSRLELELRAVRPDAHAQFRRENEYREIKYWLDYIRNALALSTVADLGKAAVLIVYTGETDMTKAIGELKRQAGPYADLIENRSIMVVAEDFHAREWSPSAGGFPAIRKWIETQSGVAADSFGVHAPRLFSEVAERCDAFLNADDDAKRILTWPEWLNLLAPLASVPAPGVEAVARATARHLHHCGRVFCLRRGGDLHKVVIDQQWGVDLVYSLTIQALRDREIDEQLLSLTGRLFTEDELRNVFSRRTQRFRDMLDDAHWPVLMDMLDQCDICVRVGSKRLAVQRELLPHRNEKLSQQLVKDWTEVYANSDRLWVNHSFALHGDQGGLLGNSDFRAVAAFTARSVERELPEALFGDGEDKNPAARRGFLPHLEDRPSFAHQCRFWDDGFMIRLDWASRQSEERETLAIRAEWAHCVERNDPSKRSFEGGLFIQLLSTDEEKYGKRLRDFLLSSTGPLGLFKDKIVETDGRIPDLERVCLPMLRGGGQPGWSRRDDGPRRPGMRFDVALSYRSTEKTLAKRLGAVIEGAGLSVYHYSEDARLRATQDDPERPGGSFITDIYDYLRHARVLLAIPSRSYFASPADGNRYCPVELADAILALTNDPKRPAGSFFWVAGEKALTPSQLKQAIETVLQRYFESIKDLLGPGASLSKIEERETQSMKALNNQAKTAFFDEVGRGAKQYINVTKNGGELDPGELLRRLRQALTS